MSNWIEIKCITSPEASEPVSAMLYEMGISGLYIDDPRDLELWGERKQTDWDYIEDELKNKDPNQVVIRAYLSEETNYVEKIAMLREKLAMLSQLLEMDTGELIIGNVDENDWANEWKKYYKPLKVGERLVIKPTWEDYTKSSQDEVIVHLDPGMAFGTGTHETTRMCMKLIEKHVKPSSNVLDVGCGSGILGISALKLGAKLCIGVDLDENAVRVAKENAVLNEVDMTVLHGNLVDVVDGKFDVVIANIIADAVMMLGGVLPPLIGQESVYIVSGIILDRAEEVKSTLTKQGYKLVEELYEGEWAAMSFVQG